jgi:Tol biopolymer transport system component
MELSMNLKILQKIFFIFILIVLSGCLQLNAQYFGKNKIQYENFKWSFLQSEHFDIYFNTGGDEIAAFVADVAENSYQSLKADLRYDLVDRISIVVYNSHNDFEQTNVSLGPPEESVGGFTEFFKNRVVIPYQGNWEELRHVVHHELTHAVMLQMVYGAGVQSIVVGMARLQLPLWLIEGLAEYESRGWDTESDMYMRDASLNGYVPPIDQLYGFMAYKGGQSVLYYLSQKYGGEKIGEILGKIKVNRNVENGFKESIGVGVEDLTKRWHLYLKREYWPDLAGRQEPEEFAKRLTDHVKNRNFINTGPALSPKGDRIAFLSDKSDYFDIYLMSAVDGRIIKKLVKGQQTSDLEELHWLKAGITWSPDGSRIAFAAKAGDQDALHIVSVKSSRIIQSLKFNIDGIHSPAWSPDGKEIAFTGIQNGLGDLYAVNVETEELRQITHDKFSDLEPAWAPDGKSLVFVSDRGDHYDAENGLEIQIQDINFRNLDIFMIQADGSQITRLTNTPHLERTPVFNPDGGKIAFTSDESGIPNIYIKDIASDSTYPITNVVSGIFHLSWGDKGDKLAFASFYNAGYDVYLMKNPLAVKPDAIKLQKTNFIQKQEKNAELTRNKAPADSAILIKLKADDQGQKSDYKNFIFGQNFVKGDINKSTPKTKNVFLDSTQYLSESGRYKVNPYKLKFTPDIVYGNASYDQIFGLQGNTQIAFSDIMGNHHINLYFNLLYDFRNSNYMFNYFYLPRRIDVGFGAFHYAYFIPTSMYDWVRDRNYGGNVYLAYPFSRYKRLEYAFTFLAIDREYLTWIIPNDQRRVFINSINYVKDTSLWGYTGPENGERYSFGLTYSPALTKYSLDFVTLRADWRKYLKIGKEYTLVTRFSGGLSEGKNPQRFFLGGVDNWLNRQFQDSIRVNMMDDIYFSSFETPLRGANYYEQVGTRFALANLEFRFPLIRYFILGWPLPIGFQNIRGAIFTDIGSAWADDSSFRPFGKGPRLNDAIMGYGLGIRLHLGFMILMTDIAWDTDLTADFSKRARPKYYFSLGVDY